ncbi:Telomerase reverse transcriptase, partial [Spiromyces aspiralis]
ANFYVTECSGNKNDLLYFRHDVWCRISAPAWTRLKSTIFEKLSKDRFDSLLKDRKLGYAPLRLVPKRNGFRPITNLKRVQPWSRFFPHYHHHPGSRHRQHLRDLPINKALSNIFEVLKFEWHRKPHLQGSSAFGISGVFQRLRAFKLKIRDVLSHRS